MESKTLPEVIYHYTTQEGLLGIFKERALWATKIHYLNDASELIEPLRIAKTMLDKYLQQLDLDKESIQDRERKKETAIFMLEYIREWENINICVASFCTNGDLLSQWRGYGIPGSAYSIGFNRKNLEETAIQHSFELCPCEYYAPADYRNKIFEFIAQEIDVAIKNNKRPLDFIGKLVKRAATMKFAYFREEEEWRVISSRPLSSGDSSFSFRTSKSMIIPYYSLPIDFESIVEIIIGPCVHMDLAEDATYGLVNKYDLKNVKPGRVKRSKIPYRTL